MKKIVKQFAFIVCLVLLVAPILSGCLETRYDVKFNFAEGGEVVVMRGTNIIEHGDRVTHNRTLTITVTPSGFNEIRTVRIGGIELVGVEGETTFERIYTHQVRGEITLLVEFDIFTRARGHDCILCGGRTCVHPAGSLEAVKVHFLGQLMDFAEIFKHDSEKAEMINQAIADIKQASNTGTVDEIFIAIHEHLFPGQPVVFPGCRPGCTQNCNRNDCRYNNWACWPECCFCCTCQEPTCKSCTMCRCQCDDCWKGVCVRRNGCCPSTFHLCYPQCNCGACANPNMECKCCLCFPDNPAGLCIRCCDCGTCAECDGD